jgi:alpha-D-ribose 1-methylphosphonate 5-triphosphate diphosphatase PhnM
MTQHPPHLDLISEIRAHCAAHDMKLTAFGIAAMADPMFVADLEAGRECRSKTLRRVREYMATGITHEQAKAGAA